MGEKLLPGSTEKGVEIITHEEDKDGNRYQTTATFRIFNSVQDMVNFHVRKFTQGR
jgi:flagellum-specific peptidoglycan hydrolase FlgJ